LRKKVRTSAFEDPLPLCPQNVRSGQTFSLIADVFYGRHLAKSIGKTRKIFVEQISIKLEVLTKSRWIW